ncbi:MAG: hypothetical protein WBA45_09025 [Microthrixaceae bacterium]
MASNLRGRASVIVVLAIALTAIGCGDPSAGPQEAEPSEVESDSPVVLGAGSPIAEGFTVPEGTLLLMAAIPQVGGPDDGRAWTAYLRPQDPVRTLYDLADQAQKLGFELGASSSDPCWASPDERTLGTNEYPAPGEPLPDGVEPISVECHADGYRTVDGVEERIFLQSSQDFRHELPISSAVLSLMRMPEGAEARRIGPGRFDLQPLGPTVVRPPGREIDLAPPDAKPGDPLSSWDGVDGFTLIEGSRLVTPVNEFICQGGFLAALDITGEPEKVFAGYVERVRELALDYGRPPKTTSSKLFNRQIEQAVTYIDDGTMVTATMFVGDSDEPVRLVLEKCAG